MAIQEFVYQPPADYGLELLYCDAQILVLNKPSGLLSVPGRGATRCDSLSVRVQNEYPEALVVHRLDMDTSGILMMARNKFAQRQLSLLFQERRVTKRYMAVVDGCIPADGGEVDLPLITDWPNRPRQVVDSVRGKPSLTRYQVLCRDVAMHTTRLELAPETGRSHQLRVHMYAFGHAILGDNLYASAAVRKKSQRLLLHATALAFSHPATGEPMQFTSEAPF